jgi:hypothetical protein
MKRMRKAATADHEADATLKLQEHFRLERGKMGIDQEIVLLVQRSIILKFRNV